MAMAVVTVASGGMPVVDNSSGNPKHVHGIAVSEAPAGRGIAVTKVTGNKNGTAVIYVVPVVGNP